MEEKLEQKAEEILNQPIKDGDQEEDYYQHLRNLPYEKPRKRAFIILRPGQRIVTQTSENGKK